jgi:hypothetical protein
MPYKYQLFTTVVGISLLAPGQQPQLQGGVNIELIDYIS